jgi:hypothetical protein
MSLARTPTRPADVSEWHRLSAQHREYDERLESLRAKTWLSPEEQLEEVKLKKLKLAAKDAMEALRRREEG